MKFICLMCNKRISEKEVTILEINGEPHYKCEDCYDCWMGKSGGKDGN